VYESVCSVARDAVSPPLFHEPTPKFSSRCSWKILDLLQGLIEVSRFLERRLPDLMLERVTYARHGGRSAPRPRMVRRFKMTGRRGSRSTRVGGGKGGCCFVVIKENE
jgi:hypothetical protein